MIVWHQGYRLIYRSENQHTNEFHLFDYVYFVDKTSPDDLFRYKDKIGIILKYISAQDSTEYDEIELEQLRVIEAIIFQTPKNFTETHTIPQDYNAMLIGPTTLEGQITVSTNADLTII